LSGIVRCNNVALHNKTLMRICQYLRGKKFWLRPVTGQLRSVASQLLDKKEIPAVRGDFAVLIAGSGGSLFSPFQPFLKVTEFLAQLRWQAVAELVVVFADKRDLPLPAVYVHSEELNDVIGTQIEAG
jgi:hypothetical protein